MPEGAVVDTEAANILASRPGLGPRTEEEKAFLVKYRRDQLVGQLESYHRWLQSDADQRDKWLEVSANRVKAYAINLYRIIVVCGMWDSTEEVKPNA